MVTLWRIDLCPLGGAFVTAKETQANPVPHRADGCWQTPKRSHGFGQLQHGMAIGEDVPIHLGQHRGQEKLEAEFNWNGNDMRTLQKGTPAGKASGKLSSSSNCSWSRMQRCTRHSTRPLSGDWRTMTNSAKSPGWGSSRQRMGAQALLPPSGLPMALFQSAKRSA